MGWGGRAPYWTIRLIIVFAIITHPSTHLPQLGMYLVSEVWYLVIAGFYYTLWTHDWLLRYRIQKKAAMPDPALIKVCACQATNRPRVCMYVWMSVYYIEAGSPPPTPPPTIPTCPSPHTPRNAWWTSASAPP